MVATSTTDREAAAARDATVRVAALQLKTRLLSLSPMIWRRVLVAKRMTPRELHGVFQLAMGWQCQRLSLFERRSVSWGSIDLDAASPGVALASLGLRRGAKLVYRYDMLDD